MSQEPEGRIEIDGEEFLLLAEIDNVPIADSFVRKNKVGVGSGEARLYVGARNKRPFDEFFAGFEARAFFLKKDFQDYLDDAKFEYEQQEQGYQRDISGDWQRYRAQLAGFADREYFSLEAATGAQDTARYYVRSFDPVFREYFRDILLPVISYVSILKLQDAKGEVLFLFRPTLSYSFNPYYHPSKEREVEKEIEEKDIPEERKKALVEARKGQGLYRRKLLDESAECVITRVNDERILTASHIKPWSICTDVEKIDHNNGLPLTPTYDRLFDQGFISFQDNGSILISPYISPLNLRKLNLSSGKKYYFAPTPKRLQYLDYHRSKIFKV